MSQSEIDQSPPSFISSDFVVLSRGNSDDVADGMMDCAPQEFDNIHFSLDSITNHLNLEEAIKKVRDLLQENQELKDTLQKSNADINEQCQLLIEWRKQTMESSAIWNKKAQIAKETISSLRKENSLAKIKIDELEKKVIDKNEVPDLKIKIMELEAANQLLIDSRNAADREISLLKARQSETNEMGSQIKAETVDKEVLMPSLGNPGNSSTHSDDGDIVHLSWKAEIAEMQKQIDDMRAKEISQSSRHTSVLRELDVLQKQVETYKQMEIDFLNAQQERDAIIRADEAQIEKLTQEITESNTQQMQKETEITNLMKTLNDEKSKLDQVLKEKAEQEVKVNSLLDLLKDSEGVKEELMKQEMKFKDENEKLNKQYNELDTENKLLKDELKRQKHSVESIKEEKHVLLAMNNQLNAEVARDKIDSSLSYLLNTDDLMSHVDEFMNIKESAVTKVVSEVQRGADSGADKEKREKILQQLQEERERVGNLSCELKRQTDVISDLKSQLVFKDALLRENIDKLSKCEHDSQLVKKETKGEVEALTRQLEECKLKEQRMVSADSLQKLEEKLRSQTQECENTRKQLETISKLYETEKQRCQELDGRCDVYAYELQSEKAKVGNLTQSLNDLHQTMSVKDKQLVQCKEQLEDISRHFNQLLEDHHEMLKSCEYYKEKSEQLETQQKNVEKNQDQLSRVHAQVLGLKDTLEMKEAEIMKLHVAVGELQETKDECEIFKQQLDVYKTDFHQEREAREHARAELELAREECERLQRQVEMWSRANIAGMQQNEEYSLVNQPYGYYPGQYGNQPWAHPGYPYPPQQHQPPVENLMPTQPSQRVNSDQHKCPCCGQICPDVDTLQIHCMECLDRMENNP